MGQVLGSAEESGGLDAQEQQVQRRHRRQHDGEAQAVYPAAGCGSGPFQGCGAAETVQQTEEEGGHDAGQQGLPDRVREVEGDKGPQVRRGGGEQRGGGGQDGHQDRQQSQGAGRSQQQGQDPPGGAVLFLRPGGGQCCPQMAEDAPQQQTEPLAQHGGTPPGQKLSAGEADGVDR